MAPSRRQLRARQAMAPVERGAVPARFLRFELSQWIGQAEAATGLRAGGDDETRVMVLRQLARLVWGRERHVWARANGYTMRQMLEAARDAQND